MSRAARGLAGWRMTKPSRKADVMERMGALAKAKPAQAETQKPAANDSAVAAEPSSTAGQVMPSQTMRRDLMDVCAWYEKGLGWTPAETAELRAEYQRELQRQPFDLIADVLAKSGALARESMRKFDERVAALGAARRAA